MCSQYTHIHSQQHRFYAFLSTFLLKSLPSSSLWRYMINVCLANIFEVEEIEILSKSAIVNLQALFSN
ncbi:unnamed protein product [Sphagnum jensenii]|uniref:Uncharacterized protein n=1 Tax=Sphagnum jensenii TaxID=128206 RepID=A0ABP0X5J3_9BRYO